MTRISHPAGQNTRRLLRLVTALLGGALASTTFAADLELPPDVHGTYAPRGDCAKQPRVVVNRAGVHLDTAAGQRGPLPHMVSYTFVGGARYSGIQIWALVKHGGKDRWGDDHQPVILTFNANEKPGALTAERSGTGTEPPVALDGPLSSLVQSGHFRRCRTAGT